MNPVTGDEKQNSRPTMEPSIWEISRPGARGVRPVSHPVGKTDLPASLCRQDPMGLPELSELETVRHFTRLSQLSRGVDTHFYPLGSCTMKYNPKVMDRVPGLTGFQDLHPLTDEEGMQGYLEALWTFSELLKEVLGMDEVTLAPAAGAHGELTGILLARKYFEKKGNDPGRKFWFRIRRMEPIRPALPWEGSLSGPSFQNRRAISIWKL